MSITITQEPLDDTSSRKTESSRSPRPRTPSRRVSPIIRAAPSSSSGGLGTIFEAASGIEISGGNFTAQAAPQALVNLNFYHAQHGRTLGHGSNVSPSTTERTTIASDEEHAIRFPLETATQPRVSSSHQSVNIANVETPRIVRNSPEIYRDLLMHKGRATPLLIPSPNLHSPREYRITGVKVADVGVFTPEGGFDQFYNANLSADHPINVGGVPENYHPITPSIRPIDIREFKESSAGSFITSELIYSNQDGIGNASTTNFESSAAEGAILIMPDGAWVHQLNNMSILRKHIAQHGKAAYQFATSALGRDIENGDLCYIYSCRKATAFGIATFDTPRGYNTRLSFVPFDDARNPGDSRYRWNHRGSAQAKVGPEADENRDLETSDGSAPRNQTLFVGALSVKLNEDEWKRLEAMNAEILDARTESRASSEFKSPGILDPERPQQTPIARTPNTSRQQSRDGAQGSRALKQEDSDAGPPSTPEKTAASWETFAPDTFLQTKISDDKIEDTTFFPSLDSGTEEVKLKVIKREPSFGSEQLAEWSETADGLLQKQSNNVDDDSDVKMEDIKIEPSSNLGKFADTSETPDTFLTKQIEDVEQEEMKLDPSSDSEKIANVSEMLHTFLQKQAPHARISLICDRDYLSISSIVDPIDFITEVCSVNNICEQDGVVYFEPKDVIGPDDITAAKMVQNVVSRSIREYLFGNRQDRSKCLDELMEMATKAELWNFKQGGSTAASLPGHPKRIISLDEIIAFSDGKKFPISNVTELRESLRSYHPEHPDAIILFRMLADRLFNRYLDSDHHDDLYEAISYYEHILPLTDKTHYRHLEILLNLSSALYHRLQLLHLPDDLDRLLTYLEMQRRVDLERVLHRFRLVPVIQASLRPSASDSIMIDGTGETSPRQVTGHSGQQPRTLGPYMSQHILDLSTRMLDDEMDLDVSSIRHFPSGLPDSTSQTEQYNQEASASRFQQSPVAYTALETLDLSHYYSRLPGAGKRFYFRCMFPNCEYESTSKGNMENHLARRDHLGLKHFCPDCGVSFTRKDTLKNHMRQKHANSRQIIPSKDNTVMADSQLLATAGEHNVKQNTFPIPVEGDVEKQARRGSADMEVDTDTPRSKLSPPRDTSVYNPSAVTAPPKVNNRPQGPGDQTTNPQSVLLLSSHKTEVFVCAFNPKIHNLLASGSKDGVVNVWDLPDPPPWNSPEYAQRPEKPIALENVSQVTQGDLTSLHWNTDGTLLAIGSYDSILRVCTNKGSVYFSHPQHQGPIFATRFSKNGAWLLTASLDGTTCLWDVNEKRLHKQYRCHKGGYCCLDVEWLNEDTFASAGADTKIFIMRVDEDEAIATLDGHKDEINQIRVNLSGTRLASCSDDGTAIIWKVDNNRSTEIIPGLSEWEQVVGLRGHTHSVSTVAWCVDHPEGTHELLLSSSFDSTARLWDTVTGECLNVFKDHKGPVYSAKFSPNGIYLATGSGDGWLHVYHTRSYDRVWSWFAGSSQPGVFEIDWQEGEGINRIVMALECRQVAVVDVNKLEVFHTALQNGASREPMASIEEVHI